MAQSSCKLVESTHSSSVTTPTMMTSVQFTQHAFALSCLSPEAAEECRRSVSRSGSRSGSSSEVLRFHYEVGVVEPHSGTLHLIQVCCQVCVEGRGCCKASVCCDAVCCQLQLPKGPQQPQGPKRLTDEEEDAGVASSHTIELPRTVAASASSHAGLTSYPITARELVAHVAKCCDLCLDSKGAACCKKDCCAVSCCLVNVEVMGAPVAVVAPALIKASCCTTTSNKMGSAAVTLKQPTKVSAACSTKKGGCCAKVADPAPAPVAIKNTVRTCCTKDAIAVLAATPGVTLSSLSHSDGHAACKDGPSPTLDSPDGLERPVSKCCTGKADKQEERQQTTTSASRGSIAGVEPNKPSCSRVKKPYSSATQCCDSKVESAVLLVTPPSVIKKPCGDVAAKGCCSTDASTTNKPCGPKKDACAPVDKSRAVQPVDVELAVVSTSISVSPPSLLRMSLQVSGMDCASCSKMVEDGVKRLESVRTATCSVMTGLAEVAYALDDGFDVLPAEQASKQTDAIVQQIAKLIVAMGYQCELLRSTVVSPNSNKAACLMDETPALLVHLALIIGEKEGVGRDILASTCAMLLLMPGVSSSTSRPRGKSDSSSSLLLIEYQPDVIGARTLLKAVEQHVGQSVSVANSDEIAGGAGENDLAALWRTRFLICLLFTVPLFVIVYLLPAAGSDSDTMRAMHYEIASGLRVSSLVGFLLAVPVQVYGGWPLYLSAYRAARFGRKLNIDALVALSTTAAFLYSMATTIASMAGELLLEDVFFETSAVVLTVILLGRYLESIAKGKAAAALSELAHMQVDTAMLVTSAVGAKETEKKEAEEEAVTSNTELIRTELLQRDDIVQVLPGARIPTDGVVVFGSSSVDEAMLTGEARPVNKSIGDIVYGSTMNQRGMMHLRVTRVPGENALSGIMQLVRQAQSSTPPIQRVADAVAAYFVPAILALAVSIFILWILLVEYGVVTTDLAAVTFAIKFAIATLVVSCPCAVGLAVPVPVMVASGVGAKLGVLFKSGPALEALHKADVIVFDKTGTLTLGQPTVVQWRNVSTGGLSDRLLWWTVASAESGSEHVWAKAMLEYARSNLVDGSALAALGTPSAFEAVSGRGIRCSLNDQVVLIGNARWMEENGVGIAVAAAPPAAPARVSCGEVECGQPMVDCCPPDLEPSAVSAASAANEDVVKMEQIGASVVYVAIDQGLIGWIALSDAVRPEAATVVKALEQLKVQVWILSGDAQTSTDAVAKQLGIDPKRACGQLLPGDKAKRVQELQQSGQVVAMVGDGINDAPALTQADIGLTVMNGSDVAMGAADVVLMKDHLSLLLHALELSRATFSVIKLNLGWAFFYNLCAIPFAVGAFYTLNGVVLPPTFAGLAELLSSLPVILFAIALKWFKPKSLIEPMPQQP